MKVTRHRHQPRQPREISIRLLEDEAAVVFCALREGRTLVEDEHARAKVLAVMSALYSQADSKYISEHVKRHPSF